MTHKDTFFDRSEVSALNFGYGVQMEAGGLFNPYSLLRGRSCPFKSERFVGECRNLLHCVRKSTIRIIHSIPIIPKGRHFKGPVVLSVTF